METSQTDFSLHVRDGGEHLSVLQKETYLIHPVARLLFREMKNDVVAIMVADVASEPIELNGTFLYDQSVGAIAADIRDERAGSGTAG